VQRGSIKTSSRGVITAGTRVIITWKIFGNVVIFAWRIFFRTIAVEEGWVYLFEGNVHFASTIAEGGDLIHVDPHSAIFNDIMEFLQVEFPECDSIRVGKIRECGGSRPNLSKGWERAIEWVLHIDSSSQAVFVNVISCLNLHSRVDDQEKALVFFLQVLGELTELFLRVIDGVGCEDLEAVHVVYINPHGIERELVGIELTNNFLHSSDIDVTIAALMETQNPVRVQAGMTNDGVVLADGLLGVGTEEHVNVHNTTNSLECNGRVGIRGDGDVHSIAVEEQQGV